jgi:transposase
MAGAAWRIVPHDLPPWPTVYQQSQRWLKGGVFDAIVQDLRAVLRVAQGRKPEPSAAIFDSRTLQSTSASGTRAGYDGAKRRRGSKVHIAVDTLGHLLAAHVTAASEQDRSQVTTLATKVQGRLVTPSQWRLSTKAIPGSKPPRMPKRWVGERSNAWAACFRRLAREYERLAEALAGIFGVRYPDAQTLHCINSLKCITCSSIINMKVHNTL